ncbi:MAG: WG repeat-containing protein [Candidatus Obscuribacterales bacterium]|nr:WG repeat-containing protein [Candidatus Obscuribacterales bacterium]
MVKYFRRFVAVAAVALTAVPAYSHDKYGLVDLQDKFVIPPIYEQISTVGPGVYKCFPKYKDLSEFKRNPTKATSGGARNQNQSSKESLSEHFGNPNFLPSELRDRNNRLVHLAVPQNCSVTEVFVPQSLKQPTAENLQSANVLYRIYGLNGCGLIDGSGKVILTPQFENSIIINNFENSGFKGISANQKTGTNRSTTNIKINIPSDVAPPFKVKNEGYKLVRGAIATAPKELLYRANLVCKIPSQYDQCDVLDDSHFLARVSGYQPGGKTPSPIVLDRAGNIAPQLPTNATFVQLTDHGFICVIKTGDMKTDWQNGIDLLFFDTSGRLLSTIHCNAFSRFENKLSVAKTNKGKYGNKTWLYENESVCKGVIDENGKWLIKPEFCGLKIAEPDRIIKKVFETHFNSQECKNEDSSLASQFDLLLNDYHLIGMTRNELDELIGVRNSNIMNGILTRTISGFGSRCGNAHTYVQFRIDNNKVTGWRFSSLNREESKWIDKNISGADFASLNGKNI